MISKVLEHCGKNVEKIVVSGSITQEKMDEVQKDMMETLLKNPEQKFLLIVTTNGGSAMAAYNFLLWVEFWEIDLITVALGTVFSAGFVLYLAGKERLAHPNSTFLAHAMSVTMNGSLSAEELAEQCAKLRMMRVTLHEIFKRKLNVGDQEINQMLEIEGRSLTYEEAKAINLVNTVIV